MGPSHGRPQLWPTVRVSPSPGPPTTRLTVPPYRARRDESGDVLRSRISLHLTELWPNVVLSSKKLQISARKTLFSTFFGHFGKHSPLQRRQGQSRRDGRRGPGRWRYRQDPSGIQAAQETADAYLGVDAKRGREQPDAAGQRRRMAAGRRPVLVTVRQRTLQRAHRQRGGPDRDLWRRHPWRTVTSGVRSTTMPWTSHIA